MSVVPELPPPIGATGWRVRPFVAGTQEPPRGRGRPRVHGDCLICSKKATTRGLCAKHYMRQRYRIKRGETTWAALEAQGIAARVVD